MFSKNYISKIPLTRWISSALIVLFFISGFTALLYQVVWQRLLGLFSGSDVRSVTIVVAAYLLGLGIGSAIGGIWGDRLSSREAVRAYGVCNLGIAAFAVCSRFLFYDLLFGQLRDLAQFLPVTLLIVFISLLIPTVLMGMSLPLLAKAISRTAAEAAPRVGLLYGVNTLGSGLGTLVSGWYLVGTIGYEQTLELGASLSVFVGIVAIAIAPQFPVQLPGERLSHSAPLPSVPVARSVWKWCFLVFVSGFAAISLEIIWFRILDTVLQSIAYTYAHLLAFILVSNALGSLAGAAAVRQIRHPQQVFLQIQAGVAAYSLLAIWLLSRYWQAHPPDFRWELGYIDANAINATILFKYGVLPFVMLVVPNFLLGFYFPVVLKAIQTDNQQIGQRVGLIQAANILGNTAGSLLTGLVLLNQLGTAGALRFIGILGLGFLVIGRLNWLRAPAGVLAVTLTVAIALFPNNLRLWAALHGIPAQQYFIAAEDSTGVAAITEVNHQGTLLASGQAQAGFPYMQVHALLGSIPALLHPDPAQIMIIGLGSGGTAHTAGVNPLTQQIQVVELLGAELPVLRAYAQTPVGQPLQFLFNDPRYSFRVGDGRRELEQAAQHQFDIIEADAIYPWRSRAAMLYSQEFFQEVRSHLAVGGLFVEWNAGLGVEQTFRSVFPYVTELGLGQDLYVLIGSDHPVDFNPKALLAKLENPAAVDFLTNANVNIAGMRQDIQTARVTAFSHAKDGQPQPFNTDLFPRSEYYLNQRAEE